MKKSYAILLVLVCCFVFCANSCVNAQSKSLKLIFIRHGEKAEDGDNLNCQGLNRSMLLPQLIVKKYGVPANIYVPSLKQGEATKHARMLQTVTPFVAKYNLSINTAYDEDDYKGISNALLDEKGTILIVWEHKSIAPILARLGINYSKWPDSDFDSIYVVTFHKGVATLTKDSEGLKPAAGCPF